MGVVDDGRRTADIEDVEASSLAPPKTAPIRGVLKLLVRASSSRSSLGRLGALLILLAALSAFAFLGYLLPSLLWSAARS